MVEEKVTREAVPLRDKERLTLWCSSVSATTRVI
jgi:hypothetical protein